MARKRVHWWLSRLGMTGAIFLLLLVAAPVALSLINIRYARS